MQKADLHGPCGLPKLVLSHMPRQVRRRSMPVLSSPHKAYQLGPCQGQICWPCPGVAVPLTASSNRYRSMGGSPLVVL